MTDRLL